MSQPAFTGSEVKQLLWSSEGGRVRSQLSFVTRTSRLYCRLFGALTLQKHNTSRYFLLSKELTNRNVSVGYSISGKTKDGATPASISTFLLIPLKFAGLHKPFSSINYHQTDITVYMCALDFFPKKHDRSVIYIVHVTDWHMSFPHSRISQSSWQSAQQTGSSSAITWRMMGNPRK